MERKEFTSEAAGKCKYAMQGVTARVVALSTNTAAFALIMFAITIFDNRGLTEEVKKTNEDGNGDDAAFLFCSEEYKCSKNRGSTENDSGASVKKFKSPESLLQAVTRLVNNNCDPSTSPPPLLYSLNTRQEVQPLQFTFRLVQRLKFDAFTESGITELLESVLMLVRKDPKRIQRRQSFKNRSAFNCATDETMNSSPGLHLI
ncbi:hypothetical protein J6590_007868 [Homalodisca vitripennis]|nr:hypothetical protein J6590_007868 [Homalodisca vitripennis]